MPEEEWVEKRVEPVINESETVNVEVYELAQEAQIEEVVEEEEPEEQKEEEEKKPVEEG